MKRKKHTILITSNCKRGDVYNQALQLPRGNSSQKMADCEGLHGVSFEFTNVDLMNAIERIILYAGNGKHFHTQAEMIDHAQNVPFGFKLKTELVTV